MPNNEVQEVVDQDPNADLRSELAQARQKLADVKAASQKSARDQEDAATRATLERELAAVNAEIQYEEQAAALIAKANGDEPAEAAPAQVAPAQTPTRSPAQAPASATAPADKGE